MFIRNIEQQNNIKWYETSSKELKDYLIDNDIIPVHNHEKDNIETWIFVDCKDLRNIVKQFKAMKK